jgi:hypothetical protein
MQWNSGNRRITVLLLLLFLHTPSHAQVVFSATAESWYQRYSHYPPQCSTTAQMKNRTIPPLTTVGHGESRLQHVTVILRHGARTPVHNQTCDVPFEPWTCPPSTYLAADRATDDEWLTFEQIYDALQFPQYNLSNILPGTCQIGQLLEQGMQQQLTNGLHLRRAYIQSDEEDGPSHKNLHLPLGGSLDKAVYFRSDDEQRTLQSGQLLLQAMLGKELEQSGGLTIHTADYTRDIVGDHEALCPRLAEFRERFYRTRDFRIFNESDDAKELRQFQQEVLGSTGDISDCLLTTICSDRELHPKINDYDGDENSETSMFARLLRFYVQQRTMLATFDFAEYSKLVSGPLRAEIMKNIQTFVESGGETYVPPFALFSGHDSTIMAILASMDVFDEQWPTYASMLIIEIHEINLDGRKDPALYTSDFGFRMIYDGKVITDQMKGCPSGQEICDSTKLLEAMYYDVKTRNCERLYAIPVEFTPAVTQATAILVSSRSAFGGFLLLVFFGMTLGGLFTYLYFAHWIPLNLQRKMGAPGRAEMDGIMVEEPVCYGGDADDGKRRSGHTALPTDDSENFTIDDEDDDFVITNTQLT